MTLIGGKNEKFWRGLIMFGFLALIIAIFSQTINLTTSDIGRHLENGRIISEQRDILFSNYYSYTEPEASFINHHWLSGWIYYQLFLIGGFSALTILNIVLALGTFGLAFRLARRRAGFIGLAVLSLPVILLLSERVEVRPEMFSYFLIFLLWTLLDYVKRSGRFKRLWLVPFIFLFWVNIHIYFFVGLILLGIYAAAIGLEKLFAQSGEEKLAARILSAWQVSRAWWLAFSGGVLASLFNPNTWRGLLYPFNIFQRYGYEVAENKTVFYLQNLNVSLNYKIFWLLLILMVVSLVFAGLRFKKNLIGIFSALFFIVLGCFAVRNIALFGLAFLVIASFNFTTEPLSRFYTRLSVDWPKVGWRSIYIYLPLFILTISALLYFLISPLGQNRFLKSTHGWGVKANAARSIDFFRDNSLSGPLFNNYDIGSALIFWFDGEAKVFVDNRPEAYSVDFFVNTYKPMQLEDEDWVEANKKYDFQAVYFAHTDSTPWGRQFMSRILADANWSLVYFDAYTIILVPNDIAAAKELPVIDFWGLRSMVREQAATADLAELFNLASLAVLAGQADIALEIHQEILSKYSNNTRSLIFVSSYYAESDDYDDLQQALYYLDRAYQSGYRLPDFYNQQGLIYWRLKQYDRAVDSWRQALRRSRKDINSLYYLNQVSELEKSGQLQLSAP